MPVIAASSKGIVGIGVESGHRLKPARSEQIVLRGASPFWGMEAGKWGFVAVQRTRWSVFPSRSNHSRKRKPYTLLDAAYCLQACRSLRPGVDRKIHILDVCPRAVNRHYISAAMPHGVSQNVCRRDALARRVRERLSLVIFARHRARDFAPRKFGDAENNIVWCRWRGLWLLVASCQKHNATAQYENVFHVSGSPAHAGILKEFSNVRNRSVADTRLPSDFFV